MTSQILQDLLVIFDQSGTSERRRRFVEIYWSFSTNMQRRSNVADLSEFIGHFRPICDVVATSQIRRNSYVIFDQSTTLQQRCRFVKNYSLFLNNLKRRRFFKICWSFSTNLQRCCDVAGLSNYIGHFRPISGVADSSEFIGHFRPICDVAATLQIHQSLFVILDQSMTSQRRCRFFKIYWLCSTKFFKN